VDFLTVGRGDFPDKYASHAHHQQAFGNRKSCFLLPGF